MVPSTASKSRPELPSDVKEVFAKKEFTCGGRTPVSSILIPMRINSGVSRPQGWSGAHYIQTSPAWHALDHSRYDPPLTSCLVSRQFLSEKLQAVEGPHAMLVAFKWFEMQPQLTSISDGLKHYCADMLLSRVVFPILWTGIQAVRGIINVLFTSSIAVVTWSSNPPTFPQPKLRNGWHRQMVLVHSSRETSNVCLTN